MCSPDKKPSSELQQHKHMVCVFVSECVSISLWVRLLLLFYKLYFYVLIFILEKRLSAGVKESFWRPHEPPTEPFQSINILDTSSNFAHFHSSVSTHQLMYNAASLRILSLINAAADFVTSIYATCWYDSRKATSCKSCIKKNEKRK